MVGSRNTPKGVISAILVSAAVLFSTALAWEDVPAANSWIPQDAVIAIELTRPKALLEMLAGEKATAAITDLPLYKQVASQPQFRGFLGVSISWRCLLIPIGGPDWRS